MAGRRCSGFTTDHDEAKALQELGQHVGALAAGRETVGAQAGQQKRRLLAASAHQLSKALLQCTVSERKKVVTTYTKDASAAEFTDYLLETLAHQA